MAFTDAASQNEINKLVRLYRRSVKDLGRQFVAEIDIGRRAAIVSQMQQIFKKFDALEEATSKWAKKNITKLYWKNKREIEKSLKAVGLPPVRDFAGFAALHQHTVEALVSDPSTGFMSGMNRGIGEIKDRMKTIRNQATLLRDHQSVVNETIARVGVIQGATLNQTRDAIVRDLMSSKAKSELALLPKVGKLPTSHIFSNMANLPFVNIPLASGGVRHLRLDHYAEMLARTKSRQAASLARRNSALSHGQDLMQISSNFPLHDDACSLYIGRIFALTQSAAEEWGITHIGQLPNGGAPFHPNCSHSERPYLPQFADPEEVAIRGSKPPAWALNRPWAVVQKEYRKRGGFKNLAKWNPAGTKLGKTTGGRERRRAEEGLPPGGLPPGAPPAGPRPPRKPPPIVSGPQTAAGRARAARLKTGAAPPAGPPAGPPAPVPKGGARPALVVEADLLPPKATIVTGVEASTLGPMTTAASGLPEAKTLAGLNSELFPKLVLNKVKRSVDEALDGIQGMTPAVKADLSPPISKTVTAEAVTGAKVAFIRGDFASKLTKILGDIEDRVFRTFVEPPLLTKDLAIKHVDDMVRELAEFRFKKSLNLDVDVDDIIKAVLDEPEVATAIDAFKVRAAAAADELETFVARWTSSDDVGSSIDSILKEIPVGSDPFFLNYYDVLPAVRKKLKSRMRISLENQWGGAGKVKDSNVDGVLAKLTSKNQSVIEDRVEKVFTLITKLVDDAVGHLKKVLPSHIQTVVKPELLQGLIAEVRKKHKIHDSKWIHLNAEMTIPDRIRTFLKKELADKFPDVPKFHYDKIIDQDAHGLIDQAKLNETASSIAKKAKAAVVEGIDAAKAATVHEAEIQAQLQFTLQTEGLTPMEIVMGGEKFESSLVAGAKKAIFDETFPVFKAGLPMDEVEALAQAKAEKMTSAFIDAQKSSMAYKDALAPIGAAKKAAMAAAEKTADDLLKVFDSSDWKGIKAGSPGYSTPEELKDLLAKATKPKFKAVGEALEDAGVIPGGDAFTVEMDAIDALSKQVADDAFDKYWALVGKEADSDTASQLVALGKFSSPEVDAILLKNADSASAKIKEFIDTQIFSDDWMKMIDGTSQFDASYILATKDSLETVGLGSTLGSPALEVGASLPKNYFSAATEFAQRLGSTQLDEAIAAKAKAWGVKAKAAAKKIKDATKKTKASLAPIRHVDDLLVVKKGTITKKSLAENVGYAAQESLFDEIADTLHRFRDNPSQGRHKIRPRMIKDLIERAESHARYYLSSKGAGKWAGGKSINGKLLTAMDLSPSEIDKIIKQAKIPTRVRELAQLRDSLFDQWSAGPVAEYFAGKIDELPIRDLTDWKNLLIKERLRRINASRAAVQKPEIAVRAVTPKTGIRVNDADFPKFIDDPSELTVVRKLGGSTGAELVEDSQGRLFVRKTGSSPDHLREEFAAESMYRALGVRTPPSKVYELSSGPVKLSKYLGDDARLLSELSGRELETAIKKLQDDFSTDAFLANWDVAGQGLDNVMIDAAGDVWRIDTGGALRYRAQGALKGTGDTPPFNEYLRELWTLQDETLNPDTARLFKDITHGQKIEQLERLLASKEEILRLAQKADFNSEGTDLFQLLVKRIDEAEDMVVMARAMELDKFAMEGHIAGINKHATLMGDQGVYGRLSKELRSPKKGATSGIFDENQKEFDGLRGGYTDTNSALNDAVDYINRNGGDYDLVHSWASAQAGSSASKESMALKWHFGKHVTKGTDDEIAKRFYWQERDGVHGKGVMDQLAAHKKRYDIVIKDLMSRRGIGKVAAEKMYAETIAMYQAFTTQYLRRLTFRGNDRARKVVKLMRTHDKAVLTRNHLSTGQVGPMREGALESGSVWKEVTLHNELTITDVPHHRIFASYFTERQPGDSTGMFFSEGENEFVAMFGDLLTEYKRTTGYGVTPYGL